METEKFKIKTGETKPKAGKNTTQTILTAAGAVGVGAIGGAFAANAVNQPSTKPEPSSNPDEANLPENQNPTTSEDSEQVAEDNNQTGQNPSDLTQPQPTTGNQQTSQNNQQHPNSGGQQTSGEETPDQIAQNLLNEQQKDEDDIDPPDVVSIEGFTSVYDENGNELQAALVSTPDGTEYILADLDGDGIFEGVLNTDGYLVAQAEANLTYSDLEAMLQSDGGYLAINEFDHTGVDGSGEDIIPTGSVDDFVSQLLDGNQTEEESEGQEQEIVINEDDPAEYDDEDTDGNDINFDDNLFDA